MARSRQREFAVTRLGEMALRITPVLKLAAQLLVPVQPAVGHDEDQHDDSMRPRRCARRDYALVSCLGSSEGAGAQAWCPTDPAVIRYLSLQDAGSTGDDGAVVTALQSTKTVSRLEFGAAGLTAPMMGVHAGGRLNRSLRASLDREMSSANSWTDASSVRTRARAPTATPLATPSNIGVPRLCVHRWIVPYRSDMHNQCRSREPVVNKCLWRIVVRSVGTERSSQMDKALLLIRRTEGFRRLPILLGSR